MERSCIAHACNMKQFLHSHTQTPRGPRQNEEPLTAIINSQTVRRNKIIHFVAERMDVAKP